MAMLKSGGPASAGTSLQLYGDPEEGPGAYLCLEACVGHDYYWG